MELSTYFRMNAEGTGQFERTLIIADKGAYVSYLEGCTAPMRDENQLHAAVVELVALDDAEIKYSTVQNWWPGDSEGKGGIYNFVTKARRLSRKALQDFVDTGRDRLGDNLEISELHPARRRQLRGVLFDRRHKRPPASRHRHQDDPSGQEHAFAGYLEGHLGGRSSNAYRGLVSAHAKATGARNFTQCDSLLIGDKCAAHTVPYVETRTPDAQFEHEATTTTRLSDDQALLPALARHSGGGGRRAAGERVRARSAAEAADGVRSGSAEAFGSQPRGECRMRRWGFAIVGLALVLSACGQSSQPDETGAPPLAEDEIIGEADAGLPPVEPALLGRAHQHIHRIRTERDRRHWCALTS